jgi:hypothetical protein
MAFQPDKAVATTIQAKRLKLKALAANCKRTFDHPAAARTSNAVDRLMNYQDRLLYRMQYFHGAQAAAQEALRAMAIRWNFHPFIPKVQARAPYAKSLFEALNHFRSHDDWLRNLLIAAALNGRNTGKAVSHKVG